VHGALIRAGPDGGLAEIRGSSRILVEDRVDLSDDRVGVVAAAAQRAQERADVATYAVVLLVLECGVTLDNGVRHRRDRGGRVRRDPLQRRHRRFHRVGADQHHPSRVNTNVYVMALSLTVNDESADAEYHHGERSTIFR
jgi:hypothetical protein